MKLIFLISISNAAVWLHTEMRTIAQDKNSKLFYFTKRTGTLVPVSSTSCGVKDGADCLINISADLPVSAPGDLTVRAAMLNPPLVNDQLQLSGDLVPATNGANHTGYSVQLVFGNSGKCDDLEALTQVIMIPFYGNCARVTSTAGPASYIKSTFGIATNGLPYFEDSYCPDITCSSSSCIKGLTFAFNSTCGNQSGLTSYYLPNVVTSTGLTITGFNQSTPTAPKTTAAPTPTGNGGSAKHEAFTAVSLFSFIFSIFNIVT